MFVRNIYIRLATNAIIVALSFLTFIFIVKVFGTKVIGTIAYYSSMTGMLSIFADMGISTAYNKFQATEENIQDISNYIFLKVLLIILYIIIFFIVYFLKFRGGSIDHRFLFIAFTIVVLDLLSQIFISTLVGKREFYILSKIEIFAALVMCVYNLIVCFVIVDKYFLAAALVVYNCVVIAAGLGYFYKNGFLKLQKPDWSGIKKYFHFSTPVAFSDISGRITLYIDKLLVGRFIGMQELGFYVIAAKGYSGIDKFIKPVTATMFTEVVHRITNIKSYFHTRFRDIIQILSFCAGILTLVLVFLSEPVVKLFFGAENIRSAFILKFFALIIFAKLFWRPYAHVILSIEKHKLIFYMEPLNVVIMLVCYYFLIPLKIGGFYLGAAALPLTEFVIWNFPAGILRIWFLKKEYGNTHILETLLKIALPLTILVAVGYIFGYSLFMFFISLIIFFITGYYFNVITKDRWTDLIVPLKSMLQVTSGEQS
jgi:teichuronic acid exporter